VEPPSVFVPGRTSPESQHWPFFPTGNCRPKDQRPVNFFFDQSPSFLIELFSPRSFNPVENLSGNYRQAATRKKYVPIPLDRWGKKKKLIDGYSWHPLLKTNQTTSLFFLFLNNMTIIPRTIKTLSPIYAY